MSLHVKKEDNDVDIGDTLLMLSRSFLNSRGSSNAERETPKKSTSSYDCVFMKFKGTIAHTASI